jgi:hypothetical protein
LRQGDLLIDHAGTWLLDKRPANPPAFLFADFSGATVHRAFIKQNRWN